MSIESIGPSGGIDPTLMAKNMAKNMAIEFDSNSDGSIDKQEFVDGLKTKGISQAKAEKIFDSIDEKGTGKITQGDIESSMKNMAASGKSPKGMGAPPPDGSKKSKGTGTSSIDYTVYDKEDKNKDGEVTATEQLEYDLIHPESQTQNSSGSVGSVINVTA